MASDFKNDLPVLAEMKTWGIAEVAAYAKSVGLDDDDVKILSANKINGTRLLNLTKDDLVRVGMLLGPASDLAAAIATLPRPSEWFGGCFCVVFFLPRVVLFRFFASCSLRSA